MVLLWSVKEVVDSRFEAIAGKERPGDGGIDFYELKLLRQTCLFQNGVSMWRDLGDGAFIICRDRLIEYQQLWNHVLELALELTKGFGFCSEPWHVFASCDPDRGISIPECIDLKNRR